MLRMFSKSNSVGLFLAIFLAGSVFGGTIGLSTGTATYTITSDDNGGIDPNAPPDFTAATVTSIASGWLTNPITDGIGDSGVWIAPAAVQAGASGENGTTVYETTFSLSGLNSATAVLTMNLTADDFVASITLNGITIFTPTSADKNDDWGSAYGTFVVNTAADFNSGTNTIVFTVDNFSGDGAGNTGGPTGLDVAASVTASASTPEPATLALIATGCAVLGLFRLRRTY